MKAYLSSFFSTTVTSTDTKDQKSPMPSPSAMATITAGNTNYQKEAFSSPAATTVSNTSNQKKSPIDEEELSVSYLTSLFTITATTTDTKDQKSPIPSAGATITAGNTNYQKEAFSSPAAITVSNTSNQKKSPIDEEELFISTFFKIAASDAKDQKASSSEGVVKSQIFNLQNQLDQIKKDSKLTILDLSRQIVVDAKLDQTLKGHSEKVLALTVLPDGRLASGSDDKTIKLWDVTRGECVQTLSGHSYSVSALTLLSDGRLASGSWEKTIKLWDVKRGECVQTLSESSYVNALTLLSDGRLASGLYDNTIKLWNVKNGQCEQTLSGHSESVTALTLLSDGRLASGSRDKSIKLWDVRSGQCVKTWKSYVSTLTTLANGWLASAYYQDIQLWDLETGKCIHTFQSSSNINALAVLPDGRLASGSDDKTIKLQTFNPLTFKQIEPLLQALPGTSVKQLNLQNTQLHDGDVANLITLLIKTALTEVDIRQTAITPSGASILIEGLAQHPTLQPVQHEVTPKILQLQKLIKNKILLRKSMSYDEMTKYMTLLHQVADQGLLSAQHLLGQYYEAGIGVPKNNQLAIFWYRSSAQKGHKKSELSLASLQERMLEQYKISMPYILDAKATLATITNSKATKIDLSDQLFWDRQSKAKQLYEIKGHGKEGIKVVTALPEGLASVSASGVIKIWEITASNYSRCSHTLKHDNATALIALPDQCLASGANDGSIKIWDLKKEAAEASVHNLVAHKKTVTALITLPDDRLASCSVDGTIKIWDAKNGNCLRTLKEINEYDGITETFVALAALPDGRLASASTNHIKLWDITTGACVEKLDNIQTVCVLTALPDGRLASASEKEIRLWNIITKRFITIATPADEKIQSLAVMADGCLATGSTSSSLIGKGMVRLWDCNSNTCVAFFAAHSDAVSSLTVLPKNRLASVAGTKKWIGESFIRVWDVGLHRLNIKELEQFLQALQVNKTVQQLNLQNTELTDKDVSLLDELLIANTTLTQLDLRRTHLSAQSIQQLETRAKTRARKTEILSSKLITALDSKGLDSKSVMLTSNVTASANVSSLLSTSSLTNSSDKSIASTASVKAENSGDSKQDKIITTTTSVVSSSYAINYAELTKGKKLGQGGFGVVYQGVWRFSDVAIKELLVGNPSHDALEELKVEAQVMAKLRAPNIVQFYGACLVNPHYCIVMEYMPKGALFNVLHSKENIPWEMRYRLVTEIACGLAFLHAENIEHRDLKSLNVLLDENSHAKLTDFGLSKIKTETKTTTKGNSGGTPAWMAPELYKRGAKYTPKADIYSLGMTFWEIAARKIPFADAADVSLIKDWVKDGERENMPNDCPPKLASLIKFCWDGDQNKRPTAARIVEFLRSDEKEFTSVSVTSGSATAAAGTATASSGYQNNLNSQSPNSAVSYQGNLDSGSPVALTKK